MMNNDGELRPFTSSECFHAFHMNKYASGYSGQLKDFLKALGERLVWRLNNLLKD
ncbi:hypothetical protein SAMN04488121_11238 [Chitinophaga filiformis]|uniref:Uncharacterized protein n=1 Tax=Chitinophaga filiformis TaxID=104663 RepID=A0A1G8C6J1_CHIFI|nr:hypothetical protein SAMN04488121_11238 [Chitinophaga filiformis]